MQWTVIMLSSAILVTARTRSMKGVESGLESSEPKGLEESKDRRIWITPLQRDFYTIFNRLNDQFDLSTY